MSIAKSNKKIIHNPKSHSPSLFIANWLCQVPVTKISLGAKILYGRLAHWSNENGRVYRSASNLAEEIGVKPRTIQNYIKELKDLGLIGTFLNQKGGLNNFIFYEHQWMRAPINKNLIYNNDLSTPPYASNDAKDNPTQNEPHPYAQTCVPPTHKHAVINNKEIKRNNSSSSSFNGELEKSSPTTTTEKIYSKNKNQVGGNAFVDKIVSILKARVDLQKSAQSKPPSNRDILTSDKDCVNAFHQRLSGTTASISLLYDKFVKMNAEDKRTVKRFCGFINMEKREKWCSPYGNTMAASEETLASRRRHKDALKANGIGEDELKAVGDYVVWSNKGQKVLDTFLTIEEQQRIFILKEKIEHLQERA